MCNIMRCSPTSNKQVNARIAGVMAELGLTRVSDSKVGGAGGVRGVSGGERRRVTIGMELVTAPKLVVMDEPTSGGWRREGSVCVRVFRGERGGMCTCTLADQHWLASTRLLSCLMLGVHQQPLPSHPSGRQSPSPLNTHPSSCPLSRPPAGLDSFTAFNLMRTAKDIAAHGRVVLMSLHQPSPDMFGQLDSVLLLARGHLVFSGPPGAVPAYFTAAGAPCPPGRPAAEHMLHAVSEPDSLAALLEYAQQGDAPTCITTSGSSSSSRRGSGGSEDGGSPGASSSRAASSHSLDAVGDGAARDQQGFESVELRSSRGGGAGPVGEGTESQDALSGSGYHSFRDAASSAAAAEAGAAAGDKTAAANGSMADAEVRLHPLAPGQQPRPQKGMRYACMAQAREFAVLFWRTLTDVRRSPTMLLLHIGVAVGMGLLVSGWWGVVCGRGNGLGS